MNRITIEEARAQGFTVDTTCYPHFAYKGARFQPEESRRVFTETEAELLAALEDAVFQLRRLNRDGASRPCHDRAVAAIAKARGEA